MLHRQASQAPELIPKSIPNFLRLVFRGAIARTFMATYGWGKGTVVRTYEQSGIHVGAPASISTIYMNIVYSVRRFGRLKIFRVQNRY